MKASFIFLLFALLPLCTFAQQSYKIAPQSSLTVSGTSTMHDWSMTSNALQGQLQLLIENGQLQAVQQVQLKLPAESLKSGKEAMDKNAYKALNTGKHANISFELLQIKSLEQTAAGTKVVALGKLTINGQTKTETIEVLAKTDAKGMLSLTGSKSFKMSSYGVEPPSFMFGSVSTGDAVTVSINLLLSPGARLVNQ